MQIGDFYDMVATIIGWYGTETLGDRAILDGILLVLEKYGVISDIYLGSLYPFYTNRALQEENRTPDTAIGRTELRLFDSRDVSKTKRIIQKSDFLIFGGGPLMDVMELCLISGYFEYAHKKDVKCIVLGCGIGPLSYKSCIQATKKLLKCADLIIVRDDYSKKWVDENTEKEVYKLDDPAIISLENYIKHKAGGVDEREEDFISINFREFPSVEYGLPKYDFESFIKELVFSIKNRFKTIQFVPMHSFFIGNDDRVYYSYLNQKYNLGLNISKEPLNIWETYDVFRKSKGCVGMRYHSIVMQTLLNGNNLILDYTDLQNGKISQFMNNNSLYDFYRNRIIHLKNDKKILYDDICSMLYCDSYIYKVSNVLDRYMELFGMF